MYEERKWSFDWKGFFLKLLVILIIALIGLAIYRALPSAKTDKVDNKDSEVNNNADDTLFRDNLYAMKDAAKSFLTVNHLPQEIGGSLTMTLDEMLANKMLLEFTDKDGNACDGVNSYWTVTKTKADEYTLKVQLACGDHVDYVLDTIGCYDVCVDNVCQTIIKEETVTEYQYEKDVTKEETVYSCPDGYTNKGDKCYKTSKGDSIAATLDKTESYVSVTEALKNPGESYEQYTSKITTWSKSYKTKITSTKKSYTNNVPATTKSYTEKVTTPGTTTYKCKDNTYTISGTTCSKTVQDCVTTPGYYKNVYTGTKEVKACGNCSYYVTVPTYNRIWVEGTKTCTTKVDSHTATPFTSAPTYSCPSGYFEEGARNANLKCYKNVTTYSCPSGYFEEGAKNANLKCYKNTPTYSCPSGYSVRGNGSGITCYKVIKSSDDYYCANADATLKNGKCYLTVKGQNNGYTCPNGYKLDGNKCYKIFTETVDATASIQNVASKEYRWSTKDVLEGWTKTGLSRRVAKSEAADYEPEDTDKETSDEEKVKEEETKEKPSKGTNILTIIIYILIVLGFLYLFFMFIKSKRVKKAD